MRTQSLPLIHCHCPGCQQVLEVDGAWAGQQTSCPTCGESFIVPTAAPVPARLPSPGTPPDVRIRKSGSGRFFIFLLLLVILGGGTYEYACLSTKQSPQAMWQQLTTYAQNHLHPAPAPAPIVTKAPPAPAPVPPAPKPPEPPKPSIVLIPESTAPLDPLGWLAANASKSPVTVTLLQDTTFPIIYQGHAAGSGTVYGGSAVQVVSIDLKEQKVTLAYAGYGNSTLSLPISSTDLAQHASQLVAKAKADAAAAELAQAAPAPVPSASAVSAPSLPAPRPVRVEGFVHPGIGLSLADLGAIKANLGKEPWASGYAQLKNDGRSSLDYKELGPFDFVNRNYYGDNSHGWEWKTDMQAVYNLARMWYFTGDANYAQKAHDILLSWATTQKAFNGIESSFDVGDYAYRFAGGAEILRTTWPGWTQEDTDTVKSYFGNVLFPGVPSPATTGSQGMEQFAAAVAVTAFDDDQEKFNQVLNGFLNDADSGLADTYANGEVGDMGRDQGHATLYLCNLAWIAEVFWSQGIDVYSSRNNRIFACSEYYSRFHLPGPTPPPYVQLGAPFWGIFSQISGDPRSPRSSGMPFDIIHGAALRKGMKLPWSDLYHRDLSVDEDSFMFRKPVDTSTAVPAVAQPDPPTESLTTGLTGSNLNGCVPVGSTSYSSGHWTLSGGYNGNDPWDLGTAEDTVHFAHTQITGDFTLVARVDSVSSVGADNAKAGIMLRDSLHHPSIRAWVALNPRQWAERAIMGWSSLPYGGNAAAMGCPVSQLPYWVKMVRSGKRLSLFTSPNGGDWSPFLVADFEHLPDTVYAGLFDCSFVNGALNTAVFSNVRLTGGDGGEALQPPPAPFAIYAAPGDNCVPLHWNEAFAATAYNVKRAAAHDGPYALIATVTNTSYTDTTAKNGTTYYYVVTAANSAGESGPSGKDSVTPQVSLVDVAVGGTVSASVNDTTYGHPAANAFDLNPGTKWMAGTKAWLEYDLGTDAPPTIVAYAITSSEDVPGRDPADWEFQGSQDGASWTTLDTRTGQSFPYRQQTRTFTLDQPANYSHYRLNITANSGDPSSIQLSELALLAPASSVH